MASQSQWSGRTVASPALLIVMCAVLLAVFGTSLQTGDWGMLAVLAIILLLLATFLLARVFVSQAGVEVRLGPFGYPRIFRGLDEIEEARPLRLQPLWHGGWGYRFVRGGWAVIVRGGSAVELQLKGGRRFLVTVDEADEAARCINQLIEDGRTRSYIV